MEFIAELAFYTTIIGNKKRISKKLIEKHFLGNTEKKILRPIMISSNLLKELTFIFIDLDMSSYIR